MIDANAVATRGDFSTPASEAPAIPRVTGLYRYYVVCCLFLVYAIAYADRVIVGVVALPIRNELGLDDTQLGLLGGLSFALLYCTIAIPVAVWADRGRRTAILAGAIALWSGFTALCGAAGNFLQLFLCRVGVGVGEAGVVAPAYSLIGDYFPPHQRARALSIFHLGIPVGSALGLLLGGVVAAWWGWRAAFVVAGAVGLILAPIVWLTIREPVRGSLDRARADAVQGQGFREVVAHLATRPSFWLISFAGATGGVMLYGYGFWLPSFFNRSHGLDLTATSQLVAAIVFVAGLAGNLLGGWLGDKFGSRSKGAYAYIPAVGALVALPLTIGGLLSEDIWIAAPLLLAPQACTMLATSPIGAALQQLGPPTMRATIVSIYMFIFNLIGLGIGTVVLGSLSDFFVARFGDDALRYALLSISAVLCPISGLLYFLAGRHLRSDWYGCDKPRVQTQSAS